MSKQTASPLLGAIRRMVEDPRVKDAPDGELLRRLRGGRDEPAFRGLLRRHGPMVWNVCRSVVGEDADAEDAFQATFLVLVRQAGAIRQPASVASWLHGVAYRTALKARQERARRRKHEGHAGRSPKSNRSEDVTWQEVQEVIHGELAAVSEPYRTALVLCYLEGKTQDEAAALLRVCKASLKNRLERGRALLRIRLERRGLGTAAVLAAAAWPSAGSSVPGRLVLSTLRVVGSGAADQVATAGAARVATLTEGVVKTMLLTKGRMLCGVLLAAAVLGTGLGLLTFPGRAGEEKGVGPAGPPSRAVERAPAAGRRPLDLALEAARDLKDPEKRVHILLLVARAQAKAGQRTAAVRTLQRAFRIAEALPNDDNHDFYVRLGVLGQVAQALADAGEVDAAQKSIEAMRLPKVPKVEGVYGIDPEFLENSRAVAHVEIAAAQARAGKPQDAVKTLDQLDEKRRESFGAPAWAEIAAAYSRAGDDKRAAATIQALGNEVFRVRGWLALAKLQARAGKADAARASLSEALRAIPREIREDPVGQANRAAGLQLIALAQAELGDRAAALQTAESIPDLPPVGDAKVVQFPYKAMTLTMLRARAGDYPAARKAADTIDSNYQGGHPRAHALGLLARAQAEGKDVKGARETADAIEEGFEKAAAYTEIARAQARVGDQAAIAQTFARALELADAVPEAPEKSDRYRGRFRAELLRMLAAAQAEAGQEKAARTWIARQASPYLRACALLGLAEGTAARDATHRR